MVGLGLKLCINPIIFFRSVAWVLPESCGSHVVDSLWSLSITVLTIATINSLFALSKFCVTASLARKGEFRPSLEFPESPVVVD